jgi:hypothetical protein
VGPKKKDDTTKSEMAGLRCDFISTTRSTMQPIVLTTNLDIPNLPGNCPEAIVWPLVCRESGKYKSLCLGTSETEEGEVKSLKFCGHCEEVAKFLEAEDIEIFDLWEDALMCDQTRKMDEGAYPFRYLLPSKELLELVIHGSN